MLTAALLTPTAKDKGEKKLFGYSFVPLMQEDGRTLPDGTHELIIHKVRAAFSGQGPSASAAHMISNPSSPPSGCFSVCSTPDWVTHWDRLHSDTREQDRK